jgi:Uma2 family endonuclease
MIARVAPAVPLKNGDLLTATEFCRRWEVTPNLKHAELIGGQVYMNPPVSAGSHGAPHGHILFWLGQYAVATEGVEFFSDSSVHLGELDLPQPDGILRIEDRFGGTSRMLKSDLHGAPELVVEVAASSAAYDLFQKKQRYQENAIQEYLVWIVHERRFVWFSLGADGYTELRPSRSGVIKSLVYPGLWLDTKGLLDRNWTKVLATVKKGMESEEYVSFAAKLKSQGRRKRKS